jgi:hypothetical protein
LKSGIFLVLGLKMRLRADFGAPRRATARPKRANMCQRRATLSHLRATARIFEPWISRIDTDFFDRNDRIFFDGITGFTEREFQISNFLLQIVSS